MPVVIVKYLVSVGFRFKVRLYEHVRVIDLI